MGKPAPKQGFLGLSGGPPSSFFLPVPDILDDVVHHSLGVGVLFNVLLHLAHRVHHRGVVPPAKGLANFYHGHLGDFPHNVHGNLPRLGDVGVALLRADVLGGDAAVGAGHLLNDLVHGDRGGLAVIDDIADGRLGRGDVDGLVFQ